MVRSLPEFIAAKVYEIHEMNPLALNAQTAASGALTGPLSSCLRNGPDKAP